MTITDADPSTDTGWVPDDASFGARLALVRQRMGWNVKQAATICGVPVQSWRTWERGSAEPRNVLRAAAQIAECTGCDYGWLLDPRRLRTVDGVTTSGRGRTPNVRYSVGRHPSTTRPPASARPDDPATRRPVRTSRPRRGIAP